MKVNLRSVLKSSSSEFECFEDQQIVFRAGNTLCVKEVGRNECQFICLHSELQQLYAFKPANSKKAIFTAERAANQLLIVQYLLEGERFTGERRSINLLDESPFFVETDKVELLADEFDKNIIYGVARNKDTTCVFIADMGKGRVLATGFMGVVEDVKVDSRDNMTLSVCGHNGTHNFVRCLRYGIGQWEIEQIVYKRVAGPAFHHELLFGGRLLLATRQALYVFEETDLLQTIDMPQIEAVLKVPRGLIVQHTDQSLKLWIEQEEGKFNPCGTIKIDLLPGEKVCRMQLSHNTEQVLFRTYQNTIYQWRCDNIELDTLHSDMACVKVETACPSEKQGSLSISTGKKYCLLVGNTNVTLWSIERNEMVLSSDFSLPQKPNKRTLFAGAVSPDGNSMLLAFEDRIRLYKILFTKFKYFIQFPIKRCTYITYSHGGQLAACRFGKGSNSCVTVINLMRLVELGTLKLQAEPLQLIWNELDDELIAPTDTNVVNVYRLADNTKIHSIRIQKPIAQVRIDYKTRRLIISTEDGQIMLAQNGKVIEKINPAVPSFHYMYPLYGVYFIVGRNGVLYWSYSLKFETYHQFPLFVQRSFNLVCRNSFLLAYSSFQDVIVLQCHRSTVATKKPSGEEIVLIEKDEVLGLFDKVKIIQSNYDMLQSATQIKLQQERNNYQNAVARLQDQFRDEVAFLNAKLAELGMAKLKQERENEKIFQSLEGGQIRSIQELEKMYDRKYQLEKEKYMNLEQAALEQKNRSEKTILELQAKYHRQVSAIRQQYARRARQSLGMVETVKQTKLQEKQRLQMKLIDLEEENQLTIGDIQQQKDHIIRQLQIKHTELEEKAEKTEIELHNQRIDLARYKQEAAEGIKQLRRMGGKLQESLNRVKLLESQLSRKDQMIQSKNELISEQAHQIGGLQKAKYVLSFRTTEIRKELEPKEALADKLKSELFKLDEEFKQEKKKNFDLSQKVQKLQIIGQFSKRENSDLKIALKHKERLHDELCSQIFMVVNTLDPKDWNTAFVKIYQNYIKQDKHKGKGQKKDDTSQQINRHLVHVEQSLIHVTTGSDRIMKGKDKEVVRKMMENSELVYELNVMRKKENEYVKQKKDLLNENAKLKRQLHQHQKSTSRTHTAKTGLTRRVVASKEGFSRERTTLLDVSELDKSNREDLKTSMRERSRIASAHRTLMVRDDKREKSAQFFSIAKQLETARNTIRRQDRMIEQLNHRLLGLPEEHS